MTTKTITAIDIEKIIEAHYAEAGYPNDAEPYVLAFRELIGRTPAATWRAQGDSDPHGSHFDGERAKLAMGFLTDDEIANGVFMNGDKGMDMNKMLARTPGYHPPIAWLTGAKERIRWLSRALVRTETAMKDVEGALTDSAVPELAIRCNNALSALDVYLGRTESK